jgi:hypothetical protein
MLEFDRSSERCRQSPAPCYARRYLKWGSREKAAKARTLRIDKNPAVTGICG